MDPVFLKDTILKTRQVKLFLISALFLLLISISLTFSPAAQARSFQINFIWNHWLGFFTWFILFSLSFFLMVKNQVKLDLLLLPVAALISGWGLITIWRISPSLGLKQTIWFGLGIGLLVFGTRYGQRILQILRDHKYLWLFLGLVITTLTFIFGINPNGQGPELWLGCCGFYFQPSEPLKLLLILYLAAYFAERQPFTKKLPPLLAPTIVMASIALIILVVQKDLGTTFIFVFIYSSMIYMATGKKRLLGISVLLICFAALLGYFLFDVVQLRFEAWINPWIDPSGRSYQIVQSLIAIASGGMTGRGPGMGHPELVPISFSDFIYSSIAEEYGYPGALGILIAILIFTFRGLQIGLKADNRYHGWFL